MPDRTMVDYTRKIKPYFEGIAPIEPTTTAASAHAVGDVFYLNGTKVKCTVVISVGDTIAIGTNVEEADDTESEIEALTNQLTNEVTTRAALGAHNLFGVGNSLDEWFAATNDGKLPTSYLASETITGTVDKDTNSIVITAYNNTGYRWGCKKINLKKNTSYTFSHTSCDGTIQLFGKNNADDRAVVISGLSNGGTVNSGDYDWWYVGFYPNRLGGYFSITDLLVKLETDADTTFQSYAKTNQELTAENQTLTNNLSDEVETRAKLGAHNLIPFSIWNASTTYRGIVWTVNSDGTINGNGTVESSFILSSHNPNNDKTLKLAAGTYKLSGCPSGGGGDKYCILVYKVSGNQSLAEDDGEGAEFALNEETEVSIRCFIYKTNGATNITFYPMIRLASDPSTAYAPYAKTNKELTEDTNAIEPMLNVLGAKNLLKNTASSATVGGITFTVNSDGSVTANGTHTENVYITIGTLTNPTSWIGKRLTLNGCPQGGSGNTYRLGIYCRDSSNTAIAYGLDTGDGIEVTVPSGTVKIEVSLGILTTVSNLTFYPMIRPASIEDDTFVPYAMTNRELTEDVSGGYIFKKVLSVSVTTQATDTVADGLKALANKFVTDGTANLADDEVAEIIRIDFPYGFTVPHTNQGTLYNNAATNVSGTFFGVGFTDSYKTFRLSEFTFSKTDAHANRIQVNTNNNTMTSTNDDSTAIAGTYTLHYRVYKLC